MPGTHSRLSSGEGTETQRNVGCLCQTVGTGFPLMECAWDCQVGMAGKERVGDGLVKGVNLVTGDPEEAVASRSNSGSSSGAILGTGPRTS